MSDPTNNSVSNPVHRSNDSTVISSGAQGPTVISGGADTSVQLDNAAQPDSNTPNNTANPGDLSYSQERGENKDDPANAEAASFRQKELDDGNKKLKDLLDNEKSIGNRFEDVYKHFSNMIKKIKVICEINNAKRDIERIKDPNAPNHRGLLVDVLRDSNAQKLIDQKMEQNDHGRSNFASNMIHTFVPQGLQKFVAGLQVRDQLNTKFPEYRTFKPNTQNEAPNNSALKDNSENLTSSAGMGGGGPS
ncbi:MAG: hypothetical protein EBQ95_04805 [Gammaproteobacteria bacterium]|nr:hypothetical protein [Gammaproteobacteria bacterium]